jgi:thiol-disulfide isomerase/thioredoxin
MDNKKLIGVLYLENEDISDNGQLLINNGLPSIMMIQGDFCGYCTKAKPAFQSLVNELKNKCNVLTIQTDASDSESRASAKINKIVPMRGVPAFLLFDANGKFVSLHQGTRDKEALLNSVKNVLKV